MKTKRLILFAWIAVVAIVITFSLSPINFQNETSQIQTMGSDSPKAAIIDQLHNELPSEYFVNNATKYLTDAGYKVDHILTDEITVDFYKKLPSMNYDYIVIRSHALGEGDRVTSSSLFTGEKYSENKYIKEQFMGYIGQGIPILYQDMKKLEGEEIMDKSYYVVGSKFVEESMIGDFQDSTIILAGCETTKTGKLAEAFLKRGASEVIGWSGLVDSNKNNSILIELFNSTLAGDVEMKDAIDIVMKNNEGTFFKPTNLVYFSKESSL